MKKTILAAVLIAATLPAFAGNAGGNTGGAGSNNGYGNNGAGYGGADISALGNVPNIQTMDPITKAKLAAAVTVPSNPAQVAAGKPVDPSWVSR